MRAVFDLSIVPLCQVFMSLDSAWTGAQPVEVSRVNLHVMDWSLPQINVYFKNNIVCKK